MSLFKVIVVSYIGINIEIRINIEIALGELLFKSKRDNSSRIMHQNHELSYPIFNFNRLKKIKER